jgi:hypothetical protein
MEVHAVRRKAVECLRRYTSGGLDEGAVQEILVDGGWDGKSSPSPELCHWLLWKLGCRDSKILSRNVPELRISRTGDPVRKLCNGAQRLAAWRAFRLENVPEPGDIVLSGRRERGETERARVFIESAGPRTWRLAELWTDVKGVPRPSEAVAELCGEDLVVGDRKELLTGWVDLLAALGDCDVA